MIHHIPVDAPYVQAEAPVAEDTGKEQEQPETEQTSNLHPQPAPRASDSELEEDFEFKRLKAMYRLLKDYGYTLRITKQEEPVAVLQEDSTETFPRAA